MNASITALQSVLQGLYDNNVAQLQIKSYFTDALDNSTLAGSIFPLFLAALAKNKQPITHSHDDGSIYCSSKAEIVFCLTASQVHKSNFPNHRIFSYVDNSGQQFRINQYSADWFCIDCQIMVQVEGIFKKRCFLCKPFVKDQEKQKHLEFVSQERRKKFCELITKEYKGLKVFVLTQCCIENCSMPNNFKKSILFNDDFHKLLKCNLLEYSRDKFKRLNFQNCISTNLKCDLGTFFQSKDNTSKIMKFDISSAFIRCVELDDFRIPISSKCTISLIGPDAHNFFQTLDKNDKNFAFLRVFIIAPKINRLPFYPIRKKDGSLVYSICSKCLDTITNCQHSDLERGFYADSYLCEINFLRQLGYEILRCTQIIYFEAHHNKGLSNIAASIRKLRKNPSGFVKYISKMLALHAMGRFALCAENMLNSSCEIINDYPHFCLTLQGSKVHNVQFYGKHALVHKYVKPTLLQNQQMSSTLNIHSHLFGLVCFLTKREMYKMYIACHFHPDMDLYFLSVDVDSFSVIISDQNALQVVETFCANSKFDYKVEADDINTMICYSNASRCYYFRNGSCQLKLPGLSISLRKREQIFHKGCKDLKVKDKWCITTNCSNEKYIFYKRLFYST